MYSALHSIEEVELFTRQLHELRPHLFALGSTETYGIGRLRPILRLDEITGQPCAV